MTELTPYSGSPRFHQTRWSLVTRARGKGKEARQALEDLCQAYWFPLYAWCRRAGLSPHDAEDMIQGFFTIVLDKELFTAADASRGKLRTFLLTALQRTLKDERVKSRALRRGAGKVVSFDTTEAEQWYASSHIEHESSEAQFDRQWAITVLRRALHAVESESTAKGRHPLFIAIRPFLTGDGDAMDYSTSAAQLGMTANAFKVAVHRLRTKFRERLRAEVADTQPNGDDVDGELRHLMRVLSNEM